MEDQSTTLLLPLWSFLVSANMERISISWRDERTNKEMIVHCRSDTGEVIKGRGSKKVVYTKYIGEETRHLNLCTTEDQLKESLSQIDPYHTNPTMIDYSYIIDLQRTGGLTQKEALFLEDLCLSISGWNYIYTNKRKTEALGMDSKSLPRALQSLTSCRSIDILYKDIPYKGDYVIRVNPIIAWKGNKYLRDMAVSGWYSSYYDEEFTPE